MELVVKTGFSWDMYNFAAACTQFDCAPGECTLFQSIFIYSRDPPNDHLTNETTSV